MSCTIEYNKDNKIKRVNTPNGTESTLFTELAKNEHLAVVMVTHDNSLAKMCDKIYTMKDGVIDEN